MPMHTAVHWVALFLHSAFVDALSLTTCTPAGSSWGFPNCPLDFSSIFTFLKKISLVLTTSILLPSALHTVYSFLLTSPTRTPPSYGFIMWSLHRFLPNSPLGCPSHLKNFKYPLWLMLAKYLADPGTVFLLTKPCSFDSADYMNSISLWLFTDHFHFFFLNIVLLNWKKYIICITKSNTKIKIYKGAYSEK